MRIAYKGAHGSVDVPSLGLFGVKRDEPIEIEDRRAYRQLRRQGWQRVKNDDKNGDDDK